MLSTLMVLSLTTEIPPGPHKPGRPCLLKVTLTNRSKTRVRINKRLAVGYRDNDSRELFLALTDAQGRRVEHMVVDYDRDPSAPSDYVWLPPGASISTQFNVFEWYRPKAAGSYRLTAHYQADEPDMDVPPDVFKGVVSSAPARFDVIKSK